jgi:hypothetical protein
MQACRLPARSVAEAADYRVVRQFDDFVRIHQKLRHARNGDRDF